MRYDRGMGWLKNVFGGGRRASTPADFWTWFANNASRFEGPPDQVPTDELNHQLSGIHDGLAFRIGGNRDHSGYELEISGQGSRELMPLVRQIVAAAPTIPGWKVLAFRQPHPGLSVELGATRLSAESIHFVAAPAPGNAGADVAIFVDGFDQDPNTFGEITFLLLDSTIGELAVMTKIRGLDFVDGSQRPPSARPVTELAAVLTSVGDRAD